MFLPEKFEINLITYLLFSLFLLGLIASGVLGFLLKRQRNRIRCLDQSLKEANYTIEQRGTQALEEELSLVHATMESRKDGILILSQNNKIIDYNKAVITLLELGENLIKAGEVNEVIKALSLELTNPIALKNTYDDGLRVRTEEHHTEVEFKNGKILEFYIYPQRMNGKYIGQILQFRDLTKIKSNETKLFKQVHLDNLTQLPSRNLFMERVLQSMQSSRRNRTLMAIIIFDIDKFKLINDRLGNVGGDKVLQALSANLQNLISAGDTLARLSADKFAVCYTSGNNANDIADFAKKCLEKFDEPYSIDGHSIKAPVSIGIALYPKDGDEPETLQKNADIAMRRAKDQGGDSSQFFTDELNKNYRERLMIESHLQNALKLNEFSLLYHPIIDIKEKKILGVEALLRWYHPIIGDVSPAVFVPIAEQNGMIIDIGYWILRTGCEQIKKWQQNGSDCYLSFNISSKQFGDPMFVEELKKILQDTGLSANHIAIEITEEMIMDNVNEKVFVLKALKKLGITLIIDDFGTGYSCLSVLNSLPIVK